MSAFVVVQLKISLFRKSYTRIINRYVIDALSAFVVVQLACLHGSGDTGEGLREWIKWACPSFLTDLTAQGIDVVFPSSPTQCYTLCGGAP